MARPLNTPASPAARVTMAHVAERAGTSTPTVSKVLNGGTDVSTATRARVLAAARDLGYEWRARASSHADAPSRIVDVVVGHIEGSWISRVLDGAEQAADTAGIDVVLTRARPDGSWVRRLLRRPTTGVVLVLVSVSPAQLEELTAAGLTVVVVDPSRRPPATIASIGATNWDGGRMAAEHLIERGHTDIAVVGGARNDLYGSARIDGFSSALRHAGLSLSADHVAYGEWDRSRARDAARALLASRDRMPTAIFACSDVMALGVYDAVHERGLRVREDVSVVGFDDVAEAAWAAPPLTTVQQPIAEMGAEAIRLVIRSADTATAPADATTPTSRRELQTSLVVRASTRRRGSARGE